ncbi:MAG: HupE/UreJ family protein [Bryobacterales bacterium]|nr:HupE/UreJ family protein [Bryobacterales bacterium]
MIRARSALWCLGLLLAGSARSHEIPSQVVARMLAKADAGRFDLALRVPLRSMRDVEVPEFGPGYLDVAALEPRLESLAAQWIVPFVEVYENGERLRAPTVAATRISLPSDRSFTDIDRALAHFDEARPASTDRLVWDQVMLDVHLRYAVRSAQSEFSIRPGLGHLAERVTLTLQFYAADGTTRVYRFSEAPGPVPLDPSWRQVTRHFVRMGFLHVLNGRDHLLFLLCLVIPLRRFRPLALIVTSFTAAHSLTLLGSALGFAPGALWFPPLVETLIAASIGYMALENMAGSTRHRWLVALGFGLVHGFGFSLALREAVQFAGGHLLASLIAFNIGVELGQLLALALLVPALAALFRFVVAERPGSIILSAFAAHAAWHWTLERADILGRHKVAWSEWLPDVLPWAGAIAAGLAAARLYRRRVAKSRQAPRHGRV